jgi:nucleoside-diphosphate-sugar epimerase
MHSPHQSIHLQEHIMQTANTVMVLGANGRFGRVAVQAFSKAGWQVIAHSRSAPVAELPHNVTPLQCDALDADTLIKAGAGRVQVIVNALNPLYTGWEKHLLPLADSALRVARETGALLMLPGNVYNFGRELPPVLTEQTPQVANTSKAALRIAMEQRMQSEPGVRSVVIRVGDYLGGPGPGTWIDMMIAKDVGRGVVTYPGPTGIEHAWAYLPDLAEVFVKVAERRDRLHAFEVLHYEGLTLTGNELVAAIERAAGRPLRLKAAPWGLFRLLSPVWAMVRALLKMRYLWNKPHRLDGSKLAALIGAVPRTSVDTVLRACLPSQGAQGQMSALAQH